MFPGFRRRLRERRGRSGEFHGKFELGPLGVRRGVFLLIRDNGGGGISRSGGGCGRRRGDPPEHGKDAHGGVAGGFGGDNRRVAPDAESLDPEMTALQDELPAAFGTFEGEVCL